ncbi:hypothetical protein UFOVP1158_27 [uncultured Caudovirales phage]|uniref:Uncharacterized protein n=1 Tax=uncultured Caudovirales phage TaxID=2100421 RepID=A0A6J5QSJ0_9CAUD|nr:hypothetical protein UFOVP1158_27 [uncultured Caudovirales phage]
MPTNNFSQNDEAVIAPYTRAVAITPSDSTDLVEVPRALNVHKTGGQSHTTVKCILSGDTVAVSLILPIGNIVPIRASRVYSTGTDATTVIALY